MRIWSKPEHAWLGATRTSRKMVEGEEEGGWEREVLEIKIEPDWTLRESVILTWRDENRREKTVEAPMIEF
jgi:hypothetical protein